MLATLFKQLADRSKGAVRYGLRASDEAAYRAAKEAAERASALAKAAKASSITDSKIVKGGNIDEVVNYIQDDYWKPNQIDEAIDDIPNEDFIYQEYGVDKGSLAEANAEALADIDNQRTSNNGGVFFSNNAVQDATFGGAAGYVTSDGDQEDRWESLKKGAVFGALGGKGIRAVDPTDVGGHVFANLANIEKPAVHVGASAAAIAAGRDGTDREPNRKLFSKAEGILNTVAEVKGGIPQANDLTQEQREVITRFIWHVAGESHRQRESLSAAKINSFLQRYYSR